MCSEIDVHLFCSKIFILLNIEENLITIIQIFLNFSFFQFFFLNKGQIFSVQQKEIVLYFNLKNKNFNCSCLNNGTI